jgi:tetratricopeptide (TPR) repeat protein
VTTDPSATTAEPTAATESTEAKPVSKASTRKSRSKKSKDSDTANGAEPVEAADAKAEAKPGKKKKRRGEQTEAADLSPGKKDKGAADTPTADKTPDVSPSGTDQVKPPTTGSEATPDDKTTEQPATDGGDKAEGDTPTPDRPRRKAVEVDPSESDEIAPAKRKRASSLTEADGLLLKGKFEAAEDAYRALIPEDQEGDAYAGLAVALAKQNWPKKVLEAEKIMKKGKEQFADNPNMMAAGAYVSFIHSKSVASPAKRDLYLEAAESLSKRAIKLSPDTVIAQQTLGLVKMAQDDPEGAIPPLKKACAMAEDPYTNTLYAEALLKVDPHDEDAKALIDEALGMDKNYHPARLQKAAYLTAKGKHEEAFTELHTIPRDQRGSDWQRIQGDIFKAQGDGPSALASWKEANRLDPRSPDPYKNLAHHYAARGDGELAIAEMHNALEILPNDLRLRSELAELALRQGKLDVAETEYRTILGAKENDPASLLGLSRVYFKRARQDGQYPRDWTDLMDKITKIVTDQNVSGQVIKKGVKNLSDKIQLSEAEKALSEERPRFREARQLFSQVITTHKEEPYELISLGEQAYNDGDLKSAEEAYGYAKEINEVAPRAEQGISKIVNQRNEAKRHTDLANATWKLPEIAIDHYRQALIADPQHPDAYYGLYKLYFRLKKDDKKAIDYATTYLEASDDNDPLRKEVEDDLSRMNKRRIQK